MTSWRKRVHRYRGIPPKIDCRMVVGFAFNEKSSESPLARNGSSFEVSVSFNATLPLFCSPIKA